jgi:tetratricopeptide (TPR) repeat protein
VGEWVLGEIARMRGEYEDAIRHYELGVQAGEPMEPFMPMFLINALSGLGSTYMEISDQFRQQVEEIHSRALKLLEHPAGGMAGSVAWTELGFCVMATGKLDAAQEFFHKGLTIPTPQMLLQRPRLLYGSARVALAQGNIREADEQARQARASIEASNMKHYMPVVRLAEALVLAEQGDLEAAVERLAEVERLARGMRMRPLVLQAQVEAGRALAQLERSGEAQEKLDQARATMDEIAALFKDEALREKYRQHMENKFDPEGQGDL